MRSLLARICVGLAILVSVAGSAVAGSLTPFRFQSAALNGSEIAQVYVPSAAPPPGGWPVLYLLHGRNGRATDWNSLGEIAVTLDRLIEQRRIRPLLVVMPEGANSWYVDSKAVHGPGDYATAIGRDLPAAIQAAFPVAADGAHRAIGGISMGGYGAMRLGLASPGRYAAIAALSPAVWQNIPFPTPLGAPRQTAPTQAYFTKVDPETVTAGVDLPPDGTHFGGAFGTPFDRSRFNAANVFTLLEDAIEARTALPAIYLSVGDDDSHLLWRGSIAFFDTMQANGRTLEFRITDGDHNWALWKQTIVDALLFVDRNFGKSASR